MKDAVKKYINKTKRKMRTLNTYKPEYDECIKIYATLLYQYDIQYQEYEDSGFLTEIEFINGNGAESCKPNPLVKILENLRKDIKAYSDILCLNPKTNRIRPDVPSSAPSVDDGTASKIAVLAKYANRRA